MTPAPTTTSIIQKNVSELGSTIKQNITEQVKLLTDNNNNGSEFLNYNNSSNVYIGSISNNNGNNSNIINNNNNNGNISESSNFEAAITSIRTNVTRVLYMYFRNVSDEYGYGAATTTITTASTITEPSPILTSTSTSTPIPIPSLLPRSVSGIHQEIDSSTIMSTGLPIKESTSTFNTQTTADAINVVVTAVTKKMKSQLQQIAENVLSTLTTAAPINATTITSPLTSSITMTPTDKTIGSTTLFAYNSDNLTTTTITTTAATESVSPSSILTTAPSITYPSYPLTIRTFENCSALFANYVQPQQGIFCNWTWDQFLCWPPTPAGVLARMHCPSGYHGINAKKFANRKCEIDGHWGGKPNEPYNPIGWTDYQPCFKPEVNELMQMTNLDLYLDIAQRTRTLEIVGLVISLLALILSLIIFCNFRSLRNNRTKIHGNLFIAMVFQVVIRLTLYLDQAYRRGGREAVAGMTAHGIENTPYLCEASYVLLEYARTAMFMWMFIEGLYLHNMVTVAVFQGRFPHTVFSLIGWGIPVTMTLVWAICTATYTDTVGDCWWNYNLTPYYWILEGPRLVVIFTNFGFLINIIRVLVVKLRQSQASDIEQTRKAVRAAIVLLPLLGITNLLYLVPDLKTPWKFALWSYVTHFLTSFQGFFIALIYCFLNGEVRAVLLKSLAVYMSVRGHPEWVPKRASMFSGAYNTAPDTEAGVHDGKRNESPPNKRNGRKSSTISAAAILTTSQNNCRTHITTRLANGSSKYRRNSSAERRRLSGNCNNNNSNSNGRRRSSSSGSGDSGSGSGNSSHQRNGSWSWTYCFRGGQKVLRVPAATIPPESVVFELSEQ